jgi:hypothetical protein
MPASMARRGLASFVNVREPSPQTSPTARFYHCRDRRLAPCCAVCAHEGANERLRAAAGTSARAPWAHSRRRASGEASHPPPSRWRCSGSACHGSRAPSRKSSRHSHEPLM